MSQAYQQLLLDEICGGECPQRFISLQQITIWNIIGSDHISKSNGEPLQGNSWSNCISG